MLDTDYDGRSLFPRQVFFPLAGEKEGWARLARNLKAEIDEELIEAYRGTVSLPFESGANKKIAVKIVDDRGIESLKIMGWPDGKVYIDLPRQEIQAFCRKWGITEFSFFGSVLRPDFGPQSDIDIMVEFNKEVRHSLFDLVDMKEELEKISGEKGRFTDQEGGRTEQELSPAQGHFIFTGARLCHVTWRIFSIF